ncbi:peptidase S8/S53 domain-containing protein [Phellopilus nigrolimitatus]|nr:peptidase S8/S53 domain-containing protein [Phellopilus nigrolimitatus]
MFEADFFVFQYKETGKQYVRTLAYAIPAELQGYLDLVHPTITFENPVAGLPLVPSPLSAATVAQNFSRHLSDRDERRRDAIRDSDCVLDVKVGLEISSNRVFRLCDAYMQLGARGTSILFASGDGGVSGNRPTNDCSTFVPTFPSGCPFITSVGSTDGVQEAAASLSLGGFSNIFDTPSYQTSAVSAYLNDLGSTNNGLFNPSGRGFRTSLRKGRTVIVLLNDGLIAAGKSPLGFLNPFLYSAAGQAALDEIASGSNPGCNTDGFPAGPGWDPVTGLGTPNFAKLQSAVGL